MAVKKGELTDKQKIFCREYIYDWNASRAARAAGYSEDTAGAIGAENLKKPLIQAYIEEIQKDLEKIAGISRLRIVSEHLKIINTSIAHLHLTWFTRKEFDDLSDDQKACVAEISTQTRTERVNQGTKDEALIDVEYVKIKLYDKQKSMDSLTKMLGYSEAEKIEQVSTVKSYEIVPASGKRASSK